MEANQKVINNIKLQDSKELLVQNLEYDMLDDLFKTLFHQVYYLKQFFVLKLDNNKNFKIAICNYVFTNGGKE